MQCLVQLPVLVIDNIIALQLTVYNTTVYKTKN